MSFDPSTAVAEGQFDPTTAMPEGTPAVFDVLKRGLKANPDQAAQAARYAEQFNLPKHVAMQNLDRLQLQDDLVKKGMLVNESPALQEAFRTKPWLAEQAHDDIAPLKTISSNIASLAAASVSQATLGISESIWRTPDTAKRMASYLAGVVEKTGLPRYFNPVRGVEDAIGILSEGRLPIGPKLFAGTTDVANKVAGAQDILSNEFAPFADISAMSTNADTALKTAVTTGNVQPLGQVLTDPSYWTAFIAQAAPSLYTAIKSGGSIAFMGWLEGMEQSSSAADFERRTGQKISDAEFSQAVMQTAMANAMLEKTGLDKVMGAQGKGIKGVFQAILGEGGTEALQQINTNLAALTTYDQGRSLLEGVVSSFMGGAGAGGGASTARLAANKASDVLVKRQQEMASAEQSAEQLTAAMQTAGESMLRQRNPEEFRSLMQQMAEVTDGAPQEIYIDAEVLNQLAPEVQQALPADVLAQLNDAIASNGTVAIPVADVLTIAPGTPLEQVIAENARVGDPMATTQAEAKLAGEQAQQYLTQEAQRIIQQANDAQAMQAGFDFVKQNIADQLNAAGRFSKDVNDAYATLTASFFTTMAGRLGVTPQDMFDRYSLKTSAQGQTAGVLDQGGALDDVRKQWDSAGIKNAVSENNGTITVSQIVVPKEERGTGKGSAAMQALVDYADRTGQRVVLSPSSDFGGNKKRLVEFYKRFGFVENKGRNKDFTTMESMLRQPQQTINQSPTALADTIEVDGVSRPTANSNGKPIAQTEEGVRNFWRWFGDSKVVDAEGRPLVVYHGRGDDFTEFNTDGGKGKTAGTGAFFTANVAVANTYATGASRNVMPLYLRISDPVIVEANGKNWSNLGKSVKVKTPAVDRVSQTAQEDENLLAELEGRAPSPISQTKTKASSATLGKRFPNEFQYGDETFSTDDLARWARNEGFEGVVFSKVKDHGPSGNFASDEARVPSDNFVVFNPTQIKSATGNDGTFDPANPNILRQGPRATFNPANLEIVLNDNADLSSFLHESGHFFLEVMADISSQPDAPAEIASDMGALLKWFGLSDMQTWNAMTLDEKRPYHERFAESFEQYLLEGKAPSVELAPLFRKFKRWMEHVYQSLKNFIAQHSGRSAQTGEALGQNPNREITGEFVSNAAPTLVRVDRASPELAAFSSEFSGHNVTVNSHRIKFVADSLRKKIESAKEYGDLARQELARWRAYKEKNNLTSDDAVELGPDVFMDALDKGVMPMTDEAVTVAEQQGAQEVEKYARLLKEVEGYAAKVSDAGVFETGKPVTVRVFHGSDSARIAEEGFDQEKLGSNTGAGSAKMGFFFAGSPATSNSYTSNVDTPLWDRISRDARYEILDYFGDSYERNELIYDLQSNDELVRQMYREAIGEDVPEVSPTVYPNRVHMENPYVYDYKGERYREESYAKVIKDAKKAGHDGVILLNTYDGGPMDNIFVVFDAEQIEQVLYQNGPTTGGTNIVLNDDIRQVFDRMIASREQIAQAEEVAGMLSDENATEDAVEKLTARSLRDLKWTVNARAREIKKLQKQAAELRKAVEAEVRAEVMQQPVYAARNFLRTDTKLAIADLESMYAGEGDRYALLDWKPLVAQKLAGKDGVHPDIAADMFGFQNGDEMVRAILAAEPMSSVIEGVTDQRMLERHGDLIDQRAIEEAANEAVHNEARARSLATELKAQADMLNTRQDTGQTNAKGSKITVSVIAEAAKQFAANVVGKTPIAQLKARAWQHVSAERRASKRWQEATAAGKTEEAVKAKQDQLLNNAAAKAANEAQAEAKKIVEFFRRVTKDGNEKTVEKGRDPDVVNVARAILAAYGVAPRSGKAASEYVSILQANDPSMFAALQPAIEGALNMAQPLDALTMDELRNLHDEIQALWHLAKRSRQMEVDGNMLDLDDAEAQLQDRMQEVGIPDTVPGESSALTPKEEGIRKLQFAGSLLRRVEQWAERIDGKFGGAFTRLVFRPVKEAADKYRAARVTYQKEFQALVDGIAPHLRKGLIEAPELGYTFGKGHNGIGHAELLHAILHTGNDSNKRKLLLGRNWATQNPDGTLDTSKWDAFIQRMHDAGILTKAHYDFAQGVWDLLEKTKPLAQKTHRDVFGRYFDEVAATPVQTPFGEYRGGYVPAQADPRIVQDADLRKLAELENENMAFSFPTTNKGFTKSRTEYNRPLMLDLRTIGQHIDKVLLFSYMEPAVRDVNRLLSRKGVSYSLGRIDPTIYAGMLTPWLNRSAKQTVETPVVGDGGINRMLTAARNRAGMALMFANVSNTLQQLTGFSLAAVKVKPSLMMKATAQMIAHPKQTAQAVAAASTFMSNRMENEVAAINDTINKILLDPSVYERAQSWTQKHAYFLQTAMANTMEPIIWTAAFNQAIEEGQSEKDAVRFADNVIRTTQGSTLPEDVSRIETGPAYARMFTQFVGYFNMMANTNATALQQVADEVGVKKGAGKMLGIVTLGFLVPIWAAEAIAVAMRGGPDDKDRDGYLDDWLAAVFGFGTIKGMFAMVPFIGQLGNAAVNRFNSNPADDKTSLSPAVSILEGAVGVPADVYKAVTDPDKLNKRNAVRDVASAISIATGLPAIAVARPLGYIAAVESGKIRPTSGGDAIRGAITGTPSPESK